MFFADLEFDDADNECGCGQMSMLRMTAEILAGAGCAVKDCP